MNPERWQQVNELFIAAAELDPVGRAAYLDRVCGDDHTLRAEVESLLDSDKGGWDLIEKPALEIAAPLLAIEHQQLDPGQNFSHYQIISLIGRGGMGEVYLAADTLLNRKIALKLLPSDYTRNKERLRRFQQEAQAASALNHPNILTIHEIGHVEAQRFIATEFVDGETLRQRLNRSVPSMSETLEIAIQIASALSAAHQAGIVHRDIKPENIMLRRDGYVKVLDFGLAKLTEQQEQTAGASGADDVNISSGLVMGTVKYMSPEQARGLQVDQRSDIFSFGIVLYEMIAGRAPFEGETTKELITGLLKKDPPSLTNTPDQLRRIVSRALHKKKQERYQIIDELLADLKRVKEDRGGLDLVGQSSGAAVGDTRSTSGAFAVSTSSTLEYIISGIKRNKTTAAFILAGLVLVGVSFNFGLNSLGRRLRASPKQMRIESIPGTEKVVGVTVSPDGHWIAYISFNEGLWVREIGTNNSVRLVPPVGILYPVYSPNGEDIFYVSKQTLYKVPAQGGEATEVLKDVDRPITFSPDGKQFAFGRHQNEDTALLVVANVDGTGERVLASRKSPENLYSPAWSPDGSLIACAYGQTNLKLGQLGMSVLGIRVSTGEEEPITAFKWQAFDRLAWLPDGSGLIASAMEAGASPKQLWQIPYPAGEPRKITNDLESYVDVSLSAGGKSLATTQSARLSSLWIATAGNPAEMRAIPFGERKLAGFVSGTGDGRIICALDSAGERDIWIVNADGTNPKQLTFNDGRHMGPHASPDGRYIVFSSNRASSGDLNIWRMDIDGKNLVQLTHGDGEVQASVSPDGLWAVYTKGGSDTPIGQKTVWKVPIDGGEPIQLVTSPSTGAAISPDGTLIACWYNQDKDSRWQIALIPFTGGPPVKTFDVDRAADKLIPLRWRPDGQAISYVVKGEKTSNVWDQPITGVYPRPITRFDSEVIQGFDWSSDGRLICVRRHDSQDVVLITDFH